MPLVVKTPRNAAVLAECGPYASALNVLDRKETAVQRSLRNGGLAGYEPMTQAALMAVMQLAPDGAAFFDVGAHVGLYSAMVATIYGGKDVRVLAFEPTPRTAQIAREIATANRLTYEVVEVALSSEAGTTTLYLSDTSESSNSLNPDFRAHARAVTVPVTTLDDIAMVRGVDPFLVKIDVETLEAQVLAGSMAMIERARPWIVCEILRYKEGAAIDPWLDRLLELGYELRPLTDEFPWPALHPRELRERMGRSTADWLLAPGPVNDAFFDTVSTWLSAIAGCTSDTNTLVKPGTRLDPAWNAPYSPRASLSLVARVGGMPRAAIRRSAGRLRRTARGLGAAVPLVVKTPRNAAVLAECGPYASALNVLDREETAVQRSLRNGGLAGYEPMTQAALMAVMQLAPDGAAFFDVGAHVGLYSAMVATIYGGKDVRVLAFEPTPRTAQIAREIATANRLTYEVVEVALSSEAGTTTLYLSDKAETSNSLNPDFRAHARAVTVPVTTLDDIAMVRGVDPFLVKIDVETLEAQVLAGSMAMIERARPWIVCEILRYKEGAAIDPWLDRLLELGYELRPLTDEFPWPAYHPRELRTRAGRTKADWLLAPGPVNDAFFDTVSTWLSAIAACTRDTNTLVKPWTRLDPPYSAQLSRLP